MSERIKAVIFDVGGVLIRTHDHSGRRKWEHKLGLAAGGAEHIVFNSRMGTLAQQGVISDEDLWDWIGDHLQLGEELNDFRADFWSGDQLDLALEQLIRSLRDKYQTAVISNATDALKRTLTEDYPIADAFDLIVGSAYEGIMKPAPEIYRRTLQRLERSAEECVFIDDAPANIAGAEHVGLNAIRFTPTLNLREALANLGVSV